MSEIEVGEYVRTKDGKIDKIIEIANNYVLLKSKIVISKYGESRAFIKKTDIVKHSPSIIDLIGEGDYVNGILITGKESSLLYTDIKGIDRSGYHIPISQYGENINTIVTKEQFNSVMYKVVE